MSSQSKCVRVKLKTPQTWKRTSTSKSYQRILRDGTGYSSLCLFFQKETCDPEFVENWKLCFSGGYVRIRGTGWRRLIGSPKLQNIFRKRATRCRSLLRKMTYKDKGSYASSPPCTILSFQFQSNLPRRSLTCVPPGTRVIHTTCSIIHRTCSIIHRTCSIIHRTCSIIHRTCDPWPTTRAIHRTCSWPWWAYVTWLLMHICDMTPRTLVIYRTCSIIHRTCSIIHGTCDSRR